MADVLTEYIPAAAPLIETDTPLSSTGKAGAKKVSDAFAVAPADGARLALELIRANSPAANPGGTSGPAAGLALGLGLGLGEGEGLPLGLAVGDGDATGARLAPVNTEIVAVESVVALGIKL